MTYPLYYKRLVTRKRLHIAYFSLLMIQYIEITIATIFFRREKKSITDKQCLLVNVLHATAFLLVSTANFYLSIFVLLICYILVTVKLKQRSNTFTSVSDMNSKVTRSSWLVVTAFIVLYTPVNVFTLISNFVETPHPIPMTIFLDITYLLYYFNNVVNPIIYYVTLKDFRVGYVSALKCRISKITEGNQDRQTSVSSIIS